MRHVAIGGAILFALAIIIGAFPAKAAGVQCGPWEDMLRAAFERYGELPAFISIADSNGAVLTITVNDETGTYTVLAQTDADMMCAVASGKDWRAAPEGIRNAPKTKREDT